MTPFRLNRLTSLLLAAALSLTSGLRAQSSLNDAALPELGATAQGSGSKFNKDWPAGRALVPVSGKGKSKGGTIFSPFEGAKIDVRLVMPVPVAAVEITGLDYANTRQVNGVDIFIGDKKVAASPLPDAPGQPTRIDIPGAPVTQTIRIVATGGHPPRVGKDGKTGPDWGGFGKIAVLTPEDLSAKLQPVDNYAVATSPAFIAATIQSRAKPDVAVYGEPRQASGHPRTLWDSQDVARYRELLKTDKLLAGQYAALKKALDKRIAEPAKVPEPVQGADGKWTHLPEKSTSRANTELSLTISNLGTIYALSGEEKYADYAVRLLLAYAEAYPNYAPGNRPGFTHDQGKAFDQRLSEAIWLIQVVRGYDLVYNSPAVTPERRRQIEDNFLKAGARFIMSNSSTMRAPTNWSAISTTAVLITGYATEDQEFIDTAMYGPKGTKEKPTGGVMLHFSEKTINSDGLWAEGAIGYQFMAMQALIADAEILWRNGVDMYRHRDGAMKKLFDSAIAYAYPDLMTPAVHDSSSVSIVGRESYLYEYGFLRYRDPRYLLILNNSTVEPRLDSRYQQFPVSTLYGVDLGKDVPPVEWFSENFNDVGYGILRNTSSAGTASLLLDYGPNRSHGHPDKLNLDLWTSRTGPIAPDPGVVWYENPLYRNWYRNSIAHNTLVVDEQNQIESDGALLVYGFGDTLAMQRGNALKAAPGVTMDRGVFLTSDYVADIFGAFARLPRRMDLAWHLVGEDFSSGLPLTAGSLPEPREKGYSELTDIMLGKSDQAWIASTKTNGVPVRFLAAANGPTSIITGKGHFRKEHPETLVQRRDVNQTVFGNVVDFSGAEQPAVKTVALDGSLEAGRALLTLRTTRGDDLCFVAYRPGNYSVGGLKTDALQAFVRRDGGRVVAASIGGGTQLSVDGFSLRLEAAGLVTFEQADNGAYVLANPAETAVRVSVDSPELRGLNLYPNDTAGRRTGGAIKPQPSYELAPGAKLEFAKPGVPGIQESREAMLRKRQAEQEAAMKAEYDAAVVRSKSRDAAAAAHPGAAGTSIAVQAENFSAQGGGEVAVTDKKTAAVGASLAAWNSEQHWLEWEVAVPAAGYYNLSLVYCSQDVNSRRQITVNGVEQDAYSPIDLPATGGFSNGTDDWQLFTATDRVTSAPLPIELKAGKNVVRLTNVNGLAANLDYLLVTSPDVKPVREKPAQSLP